VVLLDEAAVPGQAVRAVSAEPGEYPGFADEQAVHEAPLVAAGAGEIERRVAGGQAAQGQGGDLGGAEPGRVGERGGRFRVQGEHGAGSGGVGREREAGGLLQPGGCQAEAVGEPEQVAGQRLVR